MPLLVERVRIAFGGRGSATSGQVIIWFALTATLLIMCVAIVTDTGQIWINRRYLQNAADAAAMAGVQYLPNETGRARSMACDYATSKNAVSQMTLSCNGSGIQIYQTHGPNDTIRVTARKTLIPMIGGMFGWPEITIDARATALIGSAYVACPFPIFQTPEVLPGGVTGTIDFYTLTPMHLAAADNQKGNFLTIDVGSGASDVLKAMTNNTCGGKPIGPEASTQPGGEIGKAVDGFQWRIACATGGKKPNNTDPCPAGSSACPDPDVTKYVTNGDLNPAVTRSNCTRLVIIPIFPGPISSYSGKTDVTMLGFAVFYIAGVCPPSGNAKTCPDTPIGPAAKGDAWGYYVRMETTGTSIKPYDGFGTKAAVLCDDQC